MFLSVPLQGRPGPEGSPGAKGYPGRQVQYMASGSSVAMVVWRWPQCPQAEGGGGLGAKELHPLGGPWRKGCAEGWSQAEGKDAQ